LEALVQATDSFDFAILVITPDDVVTSREITKQATYPSRNNTIVSGYFENYFCVIFSNLAPVSQGTSYDTSRLEKLASQSAPFAAAQTEVGRRTHDIQKWNHGFLRMDSKHSASV